MKHYKTYFQNKVVWLTGASSGIGEQLAYQLSRLGAKLILSSRNKDKLAAVKNKCPYPENIHVLSLDMARIDKLASKAIVAQCIFGPIDIVIHNAGLAAKDLAVNTPLAVDKIIMDINYFGPVALTKALLPAMLARKRGHIVVVGSLSSRYGVPTLSAYAASKHAVMGFFESLRAETHRFRIKTTLLIPGTIRTNITTRALKGNGSTYSKMDRSMAQGMLPEICANKMLKAIAVQREEKVIGGPEIITIWIKRLFPKLLNSIIRNHPIRKLQAIKSFLCHPEQRQRMTRETNI